MRPAPDSGDLAPIELALLALLASVLGGALLLNLVAGVAGALFGGGWVWLPMGDMAAVVQALPRHLADPRAAWPPTVRSGLPGLAGFAVAASVVAGPVVAVAVGAFTAVRSRRGPRPRPARWAGARDLRSLRVSQPRPGRLVLGRRGNGLVAAEPRQSVLVVAPTQTGKTTGIAVPAILEWDGPVLATSVKSDLVRDTYGHRAGVGDIHVFDPTAATGLRRAGWTPLAQCGDWESARRTADRLAKAAQSVTQADGEFWAQAGARFLAPLLLAAALAERGMADVTRWIDAEEHEEVLDILEGSEHEAARNAALAVWGADDRLRSSLYMSASLALEAYNDPAVLASSEKAELTADWLLDGRANTAYLCAPLDEQARLRPLFAALVSQVVGEVYARAARTGRPIDRPLLLVLDEAANIAPLPDLDQIASTGAGQGLQLVTVFQDLSQIHQRWGARAETIVNNHRAKLFGPGITCARTLDYLRRILGDAELDQQSVTLAERGRGSTTRSSTFRPLAPPNVLRERASRSLLLVYGSLPPALIESRPWFEDRRLRRLARAGANEAQR